MVPEQRSNFSNFKDGLRGNLGDDVFHALFADLALVSWREEEVVLGSADESKADIITSEYGDPVRRNWLKHCGPINHLSFAGAREPLISRGADRSAALRSDVVPATTRPVEPAPFVGGNDFDESVLPADGNSALNPQLTLDRFCVNETNRMAQIAVTRLLAGSGAPVTYIHGPSGRGKSHLLNATGIEWLRRHPTAQITYLTYDSLMTDVSDAFVSNSLKELRGHLHQTDLLLFDDIQFLRGRKRTQEELACLVERMRQVNKPVIVAGSLPAKELSETGISNRLVDRLRGGLSVEIDAPDLELRTRVVAQLAEDLQTRNAYSVSRRHVELIARRCEASIRDVEGVMHYLEIAIASRGHDQNDLSDREVGDLLARRLDRQRKKRSLENIYAFTVDQFDLAGSDLRGRSRRRPIVRARQAFCLAARQLTDEPLAAIGAMIDRDHTTVMHSVRQGEVFAESDPEFGRHISVIFEAFENG